MIRVLLADDENLIRTALASLLAIQDDLEVVAQAASGDEAKQLLRDLAAAHAKLEQANRLVIESIGYARRIQSSVLPDHAALDRAGMEVAVLWEPLHLVGGDGNLYLHIHVVLRCTLRTESGVEDADEERGLCVWRGWGVRPLGRTINME